jgi:tetratricopeptide (TPR) repeat protein
MKKNALMTILILAAIVLLNAGCGDVGHSDLFDIEKLYYKAQKLQDKKLGIKPELATDDDYQEIIDAYMLVVNRFEETFSYLREKDTFDVDESKAAVMAGESLIQTARLYQLNGKDDRCKEILLSFPDRFPRNRNHKAVARLQIGRMEENAGSPEKAEQVYIKLIEDYYPPSDLELRPNADVLELPIRIARLYRELEDTEKTEYYLDYAERYYQGIIDKFKYSPLGLTTIRYLADTYVLRNKPVQAIELLETVTDTAGEVFGTAQLLIADIYGKELGDLENARARYNRIINSDFDTLLHPKAYLQLAKIDFLDSNFFDCRTNISIIKEKYPRYQTMQAYAQQILARSFEAEKDFSRAFSEYQWLLTNYPLSREAIETYRHMPALLRANGQDDLAADWDTKSVEMLKRTRDDNRGSGAGLAALTNLINLLADQKRWAEAATEFEYLQETYPRSEAGTQALLKAGNIYRDKLDDPDKARHAYERQVNLYPDLPITEKARGNLN